MKNVSPELYPFQSHFLGLDGHNLHYLDEGQGEVFLMLHGNPTWSFYYRHLVTALRGHYRCVVPDHMGCGLSDKPQDYPYTLERHIQNVVQLVRFLGLKDITLVVHDWGGAIGMGLATRHPELIKRIVVMNTAAFVSDDIPGRIALCRNKLFGEWLVRELNGFAWPATFMTTKKRLPKVVRRAYLAPYDSWGNRVAVARFVQDIPLEENHPSRATLAEIERKLPQVKAPMLIVWGGRDFCFHDGFFQRWLSFFPGAEAHYLPDTGHYVLEDSPGEVLDRLVPFLGNHP